MPTIVQTRQHGRHRGVTVPADPGNRLLSKVLRGGVLVTGMVYRHPGVLANMASTLDQTSGGRLELGLGAGWNEEECAAFGIELGTMRERFDRFEEGLTVIESLLTNDRTTFEGKHYVVDDAGKEVPVGTRVNVAIVPRHP